MDLAQRKKEAEQKINDEWSKIESEKHKLNGKKAAMFPLDENCERLNPRSFVFKIILEEKRKLDEMANRSKESSKRERKSPIQSKKLLLSDSEGSLEATIGQGRREDDADHWRKELRAKARPRTIRQKSDIEQRYDKLWKADIWQ